MAAPIRQRGSALLSGINPERWSYHIGIIVRLPRGPPRACFTRLEQVLQNPSPIPTGLLPIFGRRHRGRALAAPSEQLQAVFVIAFFRGDNPPMREESVG